MIGIILIHEHRDVCVYISLRLEMITTRYDGSILFPASHVDRHAMSTPLLLYYYRGYLEDVTKAQKPRSLISASFEGLAQVKGHGDVISTIQGVHVTSLERSGLRL